MKIMITVLGIIIVMAGILPFLGSEGINILPQSIPTKGFGYSAIIIFVGVSGIIYGVANSMILGMEKFVTIAVSILTVFGGMLPFLGNLTPIPASGNIYYGIIIVIGLIGILYGIISSG